MTTLFITLLSILGVAVLIALWAVGRYNGFIHLKTMLDEAWSGIDVQLKRRYDLIPNLVSVVKGYSIHEKTVLEEVVRLRSVAMSAHTVAEKSAAETGLAGTLKTLFAVAEQYPNLKANENFLTLQKELSQIEQELQLARRYYNGTARNYNASVLSFPGNIIANFFNFTQAQYFELNSAQEREVPKIQF